MESEIYFTWIFKSTGYLEKSLSNTKPTLPTNYRECLYKCQIYNEFGSKYLTNYSSCDNFDEIFKYLTNHSGKVIENLSKSDRDDYINKLSNPNFFDKKRHVSLIKCFIKAYICELAPVDRIQCVLSSSINFDNTSVNNIDEKVINNFVNIRKALCSWLSNNSFKGLERLHMKLNQSYSKTEWMNYINNSSDLGSLLIYTVKYCAQSRISDCKAHIPSNQNISSGKGLSPKERIENCQQLIQVFSELLPDDNDVDNNNIHDSSSSQSQTIISLPLSLEQLSKPESLVKSCNSNTDSVLRTLCIALVFHYTAGVGLKKMASLLNTQISINSTNLLNNPLLNSVIADNNNNSNSCSNHTGDAKSPGSKGGFFLDLKPPSNSDQEKMKKLFNLTSTANHSSLNGEHNKTNDVDANSNSGNNSPPEIFLTPTEELSCGFNQIPVNSTKLLPSGSSNTNSKLNIAKTVNKPPDATEFPSLKERYQQKKKENVTFAKKPMVTIGSNETSWLAASSTTAKSSPLKKPVTKTQTNSPKKTAIATDSINEVDRQKLMLDLNSKRQQIIKQRKETDKSRHKIIENHKKEAFFNTLSSSNNSSRRNSHEEKSPEKVALLKDNNKVNDLSVLDEELSESLVISEIHVDHTKPTVDVSVEDNDVKPVEVSENCVDNSNEDKPFDDVNPTESADKLDDAKPPEILHVNDDKIDNDIKVQECSDDTKIQLESSTINDGDDNSADLKGDVIYKEPTIDSADEDGELENELSPDSVNGSFNVQSLELVEKPEDDVIENNDALNMTISNVSTGINENNGDNDNKEIKALTVDDKSLVSSTLSSLTDDLDSDQSKHSNPQQQPPPINLHQQLIEMDQQLSSSFVIPKPSSPITVLYNTDKTPTNKSKEPNLFISFDISGNCNDENEDDNKSHNGSLSTSLSIDPNSPNPANQPVAFIIDESLSQEPNGKGEKEIDDARRLKDERLAKLEENRLKRLEKVKLNSERKKEQLQQKTYELERQKEEKKRQEKEKRNSAYVKYLESKEETDAPLTNKKSSQMGASTQHLASMANSNANISASVGTQAKLRPRSNTVVNTNHSSNPSTTGSPAHQRNTNTSTLQRKNTGYASIRKNDRSTSASTPRLNSLVHDNSTNSNNFGKPLPVQDYTTPGGSTRLYKLPQSKSNRPVIINAINYCCLAGSVNEPNKQAVLKKLSETDGCHFMVLFRDTRCQYRALYSFCLSSEQLHLVTGHGPRVINHEMVDKFYKYSSGAKQFKLINSTKHLSPAIDGICIHAHLWSSNQTNSGLGSSRMNSALSTSRIFNKS